MLPVLEDITTRLASFPDVERVVLFGSRARGDHEARSDIDLAIDLAIGCRDTGGAWSEVEVYLEEEAPTLLAINAVRLEDVPATLRGHIERDGVTLYER